MNDALVAVLVALIASMGSGWAVLTVRAQSKKLRAEATSIDIASMRQSVQTAREEADRAVAARNATDALLQEMRLELEECRRGRAEMLRQMTLWVDFVRANFDGFDLKTINGSAPRILN